MGAGEPYYQVPGTCPRHPNEHLRWEGRVLRCGHAEHRLGRDEYGPVVVAHDRCGYARSLNSMFTDATIGRKLDVGAQWWQFVMEYWAYEDWRSGRLAFPPEWGVKPKGVKVKVAEPPGELFDLDGDGELMPLREAEAEADENITWLQFMAPAVPGDASLEEPA